MGELIERQAVIDLWDKYHHTIAVDAMHYDAELRQLPSAPPTQLTDDDIETIRVHLSAIKENLCNQHRWNEAKEYEALIDRLTAQPEPHYDEWCTDCKEYDKEKHSCPRWNRVIRQTLQDAQPEPCEDAVSRQAAIAQMQGLTKWNGIIADSCVDFEDVISVLENKENLPPVTPKQRTGKWIVPSQVPDMVRGYWAKCSACGHSTFGGGKFCRECGAKMEGDAE